MKTGKLNRDEYSFPGKKINRYNQQRANRSGLANGNHFHLNIFKGILIVSFWSVYLTLIL